MIYHKVDLINVHSLTKLISALYNVQIWKKEISNR